MLESSGFEGSPFPLPGKSQCRAPACLGLYLHSSFPGNKRRGRPPRLWAPQLLVVRQGPRNLLAVQGDSPFLAATCRPRKAEAQQPSPGFFFFFLFCWFQSFFCLSENETNSSHAHMHSHSRTRAAGLPAVGVRGGDGLGSDSGGRRGGELAARCPAHAARSRSCPLCAARRRRRPAAGPRREGGAHPARRARPGSRGASAQIARAAERAAGAASRGVVQPPRR